MNKIFYLILIIFIIIILYNQLYINYNTIIKKYNIIRDNDFYSCLSYLSTISDRHIGMYYKYIDLINSNEKSTNMFYKSKISVKINFFSDDKDITLKYFTKLCKYAKKYNIFIWISALYESTLDIEYDIYNQLSINYDNIGITLSCSHDSVNKKVTHILNNKSNAHIRLVKGIYKGTVTNNNRIKQIFINNAKKICKSNNYHCICTHDFYILNKLNLYNNKNLELSFYFKNIKYVQTNLIKYNINVKNISIYIVSGNKLLSIFDNNIKLPYYHKKKILLRPYHNMIY